MPTCGDPVSDVVAIIIPRTHLASRRRRCGHYQQVDLLGECMRPVPYRVNMISGCLARRSDRATGLKDLNGIPRPLA